MPSARRDDFLKAFAVEFAKHMREPTTDRPTVRCVSRKTLYEVIGEVQGSLEKNGVRRDEPKASLARFLESISVLRRIPTARTSFRPTQTELFVVEYGPQDEMDVSHFELLQAAVPKGIVCYFSALAFHQLTTQVPGQHHIAEIRTGNAPGSGQPRTAPPKEDIASKAYSKFGTEMFRYAGIPYYFTSRSAALLAAHNARFLNPHTIVRVTSLSQTLVDTLHMPIRCGGPSVVMESWENAIDEGRLDQKDIAALLTKLEYSKLTRRVGCLLERLLPHIEETLASVLHAESQRLEGRDDVTTDMLFPGYEGNGFDMRWRLTYPK